MIEVDKDSTTKATGIERILRPYQIGQEDSIGIGDSLNDLEMIPFCAIAIAMENGNETLTQMSDDIVFARSDDGIDHCFKKYGLT